MVAQVCPSLANQLLEPTRGHRLCLDRPQGAIVSHVSLIVHLVRRDGAVVPTSLFRQRSCALQFVLGEAGRDGGDDQRVRRTESIVDEMTYECGIDPTGISDNRGIERRDDFSKTLCFLVDVFRDGHLVAEIPMKKGIRGSRIPFNSRFEARISSSTEQRFRR